MDESTEFSMVTIMALKLGLFAGYGNSKKNTEQNSTKFSKILGRWSVPDFVRD